MKWNYIATGKTKVAFDYNTDITEKESLTFKMVNTLGEEIEKTIAINDQFYLDMIDHNLTKETETQKALTVNYKEGSTTKQYKVGDTSAWVNYGGTIRLDDYQILETLGSENRTPHIYLRQVDKIGNEIIVESKLNYTIPNSTIYTSEDTIIEGESILACVENNNLESGNYIFKVTGTTDGQTEETIEYPVELYNYDGDAIYITNNRAIINGRNYTGFGHINSEKRMLILKYNGNLTINSGVVITPQGTNAKINGVTGLCTKKGMLIYCAGTLTNNGTITMTARGTVNEAGENVYLYKNEDGTYEYIPAVGVTGASGVSHYGSIRFHGKTPSIATNRKTGGGGSGGAYNQFDFGASVISGNGGTGTSYSGGPGGGSGYAGGNVTIIQGNSGSSTGGYGGSGYVGGAGNPGRNGGETGTGGLLIICANTIKNNAVISSNGRSTAYGEQSSGGGSGGGSINIFHKSSIIKGVISVTGGAGGKSKNNNERGGGAGGIGSATIGNISTGTFVKDE